MHKIIEQLNTENERLSNIVNNNNGDNNNGFNEENCIQQLKNKYKILKTMEIAMSKALNENLELKKNYQEEQNKNLLNNIINKKII